MLMVSVVLNLNFSKDSFTFCFYNICEELWFIARKMEIGEVKISSSHLKKYRILTKISVYPYRLSKKLHDNDKTLK